MNWDDLRFVLAVGRQQTLAAAARALGVDATTVGRRILAIEAQLGSRLFERTNEGFVPSHTGEIAMARAEEIELQTLSLAREVEGSDRRVEGPVRITALDGFLNAIVIPQLPRLWERHPGLVLTLISDLRLFDLSRREADVGIRYSKPTHPDMVGRRLGTQVCGLYVARHLAVGAAPPLVAPPSGLDGSKETQAVREHFPGGRIAARANAEIQMQALIRAGAGIGLLDCFAGDPDPALRRAVPEPVLRNEIWAVVHVDMHRAPRVRAVLDFITDVVAENASLMEGLAVPACRP